LTLFGRVDVPAEGALVYQHGFEVHGWAFFSDGRRWETAVVRLGSTVIGTSTLHFDRPDVIGAAGAAAARAGFVVRCEIPVALRALEIVPLECEVIDNFGTTQPIALRTVRFSKIDYQIHGHGYILADGPAPVLVRDRVYGSGPPAPYADPLQVDLVTRYLRTGDRVLDVGCGIGAYQPPLTERGIEWTGCEARADFVERMQGQGLRAVHTTDELPFADKSFDATICIEVLEHVANYDAFLKQVARVSRRAAIFSVPNFGAVPVTSSFYALPWHMLESDHKNFFTTRSLAGLLANYYAHVETFEYGPLPAMHSPDGLAINNHVFAIGWH
jgi:2-polyprenyl-3-methyl-5-hydroxy-6-metoxy-1,4-benzoquinol methylase